MPLAPVQSLGFTRPAMQLSYAQAFSEFANIDILKTDFDGLKKISSNIQDTIQVFQIWHKLCSELTSM
jgi:elongation factor P--beta-lysine ligase